MTANADARSEAPTGASPASPASPDPLTSELRRIASRGTRKMSGENFPVALRGLPRRVRDHLRRAYAYARFVDDIGDEAGGDRLALLDALERDVQALPGGRATLDPVRRLTPLIVEHDLALEPLLDLIEANRRDQRVSRYDTFEELLGYCRLSAAPVGRIVLAIAGVDDALAVERSDRVCAALQVLEHCQDVGEDAAAGRVYLPAAELRGAGVRDGDLLARRATPQLRRVIAAQVQRSERLLAEGDALVRQLTGWSRFAVAGYVGGGRATADALRRAGYDVLAQPVRPRRLATLRHAARLAVGR